MEHEINDFDQLALIRERRENLEAELAKYDEHVYDMESIYLKHCLALGGNLFDGFGTELSVFTNNALAIVNTVKADTELDNKEYLQKMLEEERKATAAIKVEEEERTGKSGDVNKMENANADENKDVNSSALTLPTVNDLYTRNAVKNTSTMFSSTINPLTVYEKNKCRSFAARIHNFSPTERIFSTSSTGAIGRVERIKAIRKLNAKSHIYKTKQKKEEFSSTYDDINNCSDNYTNCKLLNLRTIANANQNSNAKNNANFVKKERQEVVNVKRERSEDGIDEVVSDDNIESKSSSRRKTRRRDSESVKS